MQRYTKCTEYTTLHYTVPGMIHTMYEVRQDRAQHQQHFLANHRINHCIQSTIVSVKHCTVGFSLYRITELLCIY